MNYKTLKIALVCCALLAGTQNVRAFKYQQNPDFHIVQPTPVSYAFIDLTKKKLRSQKPSGSSSITKLSTSASTGASYDVVGKAWQMTTKGSGGFNFSLTLSNAGMVQVAANMSVNFSSQIATAQGEATVSVKVGNYTASETFSTSQGGYNMVVFELPDSVLTYATSTSNPNSIQLYLGSSSANTVFVKDVSFLPRKIIASSNGVLNTTVFTQFGETNQVTGTLAADGKIWTRAYGLNPNAEMIPGPTLHFKPGDLVNVNLVNLLTPTAADGALSAYDEFQAADPGTYTDEVLVEDTLRGEFNIPHNINNTNLHVHGLHVDPSKDDVTIVIVPKGEDTSAYDAPHHNHPVSKISELNEYSVADQSVKPGEWKYQYKIPDIHLPGTHWFHPHKHGATAAQVENGLAGTIVIEENATNAIVPQPKVVSSISSGTQSAYNLKEWQNRHDRVLAFQEVTNYGFTPGGGNGLGTSADVAKPKGQLDLVMNGKNDYQISIRPQQLERWRLVNAGTNHRAFSQVWLGKKTTKTHSVTVRSSTTKTDTVIVVDVYKTADMYLVAVDGVTLPEKIKVTAQNPALMAPGNRNDFLVQLDEGEYTLFKNYNIQKKHIAIEDANGNIIYNSIENNSSFWPALAPVKSNPYLFARTSSSLWNWEGFVQNWKGTIKPIVPLIKTQFADSNKYIDVKFATAKQFYSGAKGMWQPALTGVGQLSDGELMQVSVSGTAVSATNTPQMPTDTYLSTIAPATSGDAPSYVSPISKKEDVLQSRPVTFDVSGLQIKATNKATNKSNGVNQFTLNGRFFILNDPIGNTNSDTLIKVARFEPDDVIYGPDSATIARTTSLAFASSGSDNWSTKNVSTFDTANAIIKKKDQVFVKGSSEVTAHFFANPGYYQSVVVPEGGSGYEYDELGVPSWADISGLSDTLSRQRTAAINTDSKHYTLNKALLPTLPLAKTAEEWILIKNSDVSHPFHIHINPFFVVEVGQLSYERYGTDSYGNEKYDWFMRAVTSTKSDVTQRADKPATGAIPGTVYKGEMAVNGIVGNWWDTIIIPAHGYVKVRYWFNVPNQTESKKGKITVADNYNKTGIWVYHCHILRHEDRGMMMPVITLPQKPAASGQE